LAVLHCLRGLIPFRDIIGCVAQDLSSAPNPQTVGYLLEYLFAFGLIARLNLKCLYEMTPSKRSFRDYISSATPNEIFFPNHCCGPDIVYKHDGVLYLVQVKFVNIMSKQDRVKACVTTDPKYFYCNRTSKKVLKGFEEERDSILSLLGNNYKRLVFLHTKTQTTDGMDEEVEVINQEKCPNCFQALKAEIWPLLDAMRETFATGKVKRSHETMLGMPE